MRLSFDEESAYKIEARKAWTIVERLYNDYDILNEMNQITRAYSWPCRDVEAFWEAIEGMKKSIRKELNDLKKTWR